jgi:hypothetical protein
VPNEYSAFSLKFIYYFDQRLLYNTRLATSPLYSLLTTLMSRKICRGFIKTKGEERGTTLLVPLLLYFIQYM